MRVFLLVCWCVCVCECGHVCVCVLTVRQVHHDSTGQSTQHSFIEIEGPIKGLRGSEGR
jgi:hypothetical protein